MLMNYRRLRLAEGSAGSTSAEDAEDAALLDMCTFCGVQYVPLHLPPERLAAEVHYNLARTCHMAGLRAMAMHFYDLTLDEWEDGECALPSLLAGGTEDVWDVRREAAIGLSSLLRDAGDHLRAQDIVARFLRYE